MKNVLKVLRQKKIKQIRLSAALITSIKLVLWSFKIAIK